MIDAILPAMPAPMVGTSTVQDPKQAVGTDFERKLQAAVTSVSDTQNTADVRLSALASGEEADIHSTMIALQEADITLRMMVATRDKVVEAYQTVMNITV